MILLLKKISYEVERQIRINPTKSKKGMSARREIIYA